MKGENPDKARQQGTTPNVAGTPHKGTMTGATGQPRTTKGAMKGPGGNPSIRGTMGRRG